MDDPKVIAARYAKEANEAIDGAAQVAKEAYAKINADPPTFDTKDAIKSFVELTRIAIKGAADMARIPLQTPTDPRVMLLADHVTTVVGRGLLEATQVAGEAANVIDDEPMNPDRNQLVRSAVKIARIGMLRSAEIAQTIAAGPGAYADPILHSDYFHIDAVNYDRTLKVDTLGRTGITENVAKLVSVDLPNGILPANMDSFRLVANSAGLPSGVYVGTVKAYKPGNAASEATVEVSFAL